MGAGAPGTAGTRGSSRISRGGRGVIKVEVDVPDGSSRDFDTSSSEATMWKRRRSESVLSSIAEELDCFVKKGILQYSNSVKARTPVYASRRLDKRKTVLLLAQAVVISPMLACSVDWKTDCPTHLLS